jgi:hypothetical protein
VTTERKVNSSITAARQSKLNAPILPQEPNNDKMPIARQHYLAMRRFIKLSLQRSDYTIREIETRLYPTIRHADGCAAIDNDEVHCLPECPDRELRMTLRCILESLIDLTEQAPLRKFGADEEYLFPTRDGYTAMVVEIEYLRDRLAELEPGSLDRIGAPEIPTREVTTDEAREAEEARS